MPSRDEHVGEEVNVETRPPPRRGGRPVRRTQRPIPRDVPLYASQQMRRTVIDLADSKEGLSDDDVHVIGTLAYYSLE